MGLPRVGVAALNEATVGAVRSTVTVVPVNALAGPALPAASLTAPAPRVSTTVPSLGALRDSCTVTVVPLAADTPDTAHPLDVPPTVKSPAASPLTGSLKVSV